MSQKREDSATNAAEILAIDALAWLAGEAEALDRFLAVSGLAPATLRQAAADPAFLRGVLEYFAGDEKLLMAFAAGAGVKPERVVAACRALGGFGGEA